MPQINDSRESILAKIKKAKPSARPLPEIPTFEIAGDALRNFIGHVKGFDGDCRLFASRSQAIEWLQNNVATRTGVVYSALDDVKTAVTIADFATPAAMHTIDTCIAEAILGIGETGSLLVDAKALGSPAAALFSTDLFLLIDRNKIVDGVQHAYAQFDPGDYQYCSFFSGPSATADIEAVHITGAQGEISLTAIVYNCSAEEMKSDADIPASTPCAPAIKLRREADAAKGCDSI